MTAAATEARAERVLVLMTNRKDAERTAEVLAAAGLEGVACADGPELCRELETGVGALLLNEETLLADRDECVRAALAGQPAWSSIPLVTVVREGAAVDPRDSLLSDFAANVTLIERPVRMRTLVSVVRGALRARRHQYEIRDAMIERERQADALRESRERLRQIFESVKDYAIFTTDVDGVVTTWNAGAEAVFGWAEDEIVGRPGDLLYTPEDRAAGVPEQELRAAAETGRGADERWHLRQDGSRFFASGTVTPLRDGSLRGFTKVARDVTDRKLADERLRESEARRRLALDAAELGSWHVDPGTMELTTDERFREIFGVTGDRIEYEQAVALIHPDDRARVRDAVAAATRPENPAPYAIEYRVTQPDESARWVFAKGRANVEGEGEARRLVSFDGTVADVTDRKRAEEQLRESEERFEFVRRSSGVGFWYCDLPFDVLEWDDQVKAHFHLPPDAPVTIGTFYDRIHPDDREPTRAAIERSIADHAPYDTDYRTIDPATGEIRWVRAIGRTFYAADGTPNRFDGVTFEVTERKRAEQAQRRSEERYRALATATAEVAYGMAADWSSMLPLDGRGLVASNVEPISDWLTRNIPPEEHDRLTKTVAAAIAGKTLFDLEHRIYRPDGSVAWTHSRAVPILDDAGDIIEWFGVAADVTDRKRAEDALRESEERFRTLFETMDEGFCVVQMIFDGAGRPVDYRIAEMNPAFEKHTGLRGAVGKTASEFAPDLDGFWFETYGKVAVTGEPARFVNRAEALEGRWFEVYAFRFGAPEERKVAILFSDVSDRKRAEDVLRESEQRFRAMADASPAMLWLTDPDGHCTFLSRRWYEFTGQTEAEALGLGWTTATHPDDAKEAGRIFLAANAAREIMRTEYRLRGRDGEYRWAIDVGRPWFSPSGEYLGMVGVVFDIDDRRRAELALREAHGRLEERVRERTEELARANDFLQTLLENVQDGIVACDANGMLTMFNRATREFHGLPQEPVPPSEWVDHYDIYRGDGRTPMPLGEVPLFRALAGERVRDAEMVIAPKNDGAPRWLRASGQAFYDAAGSKLGAVVSMHDVTEKRRAEENLRRAHEQTERLVEERTAELAAANAALRDADRRKDEFLAMLAHELRNPLAPIRTGLDLLAMQDVEPDVISPMQEQVEHVVRLVDDLLDVSRIMRGKVDLKKEPVDLAAVANRAAAAVRPAIDAHGQRLFIELPAEPVRLEADAVRLTQVVSNLVGNASKYTPDGGEIRLSVRREDGTAVVTVADTGLGIAPELLPKVFDLFIQAAQSLDRAQGGLGIGLTVVKSLVELHGGTVTATSDGPGRGSEFTVRLPVLSPAEAAPAAKALPSAAACRVLVVDDNTAAAKLLSVLLRKLGEHDVAVAHDGESAIEAAVEHRPDLVLLDIGLPRLDGFEVARRLRQKPEFRDTLLVALTGYGSPEDRAKSLEAGFDAHLVKPPGVDMLRKVLAHPKLSTT